MDPDIEELDFEDDKAFLDYVRSNSRFPKKVSISKLDDEYSLAVQTCFEGIPTIVPQLLENLDPSTRVATMADVLWASCYKEQFELASEVVRRLETLNSDAGRYERGFCLAVYHGNLGLMQQLRNAGVDINCQPRYPLAEVYRIWNRTMCDCGPFRNEEDPHHCFLGMSPLSVACSYRSDETIAKWLLENGATLLPTSGIPPCHAAARHGRSGIIQWLQTQGADIERMFDGQTLLHSACDSGDAQTVNYLVDQRFDARAVTEKGWTTLTILCRRTFSVVHGNASATSQCSSARTLIEHGADVNGVGPHDQTPFYLALQYSRNKMLALYLVDCRADVHLHDPIGRCADNSFVSKESKEIILSVIKALDEKSRSRIVVKSNDADFRTKLAALDIETKKSTRPDWTPYEDIPELPYNRPYS